MNFAHFVTESRLCGRRGIKSLQAVELLRHIVAEKDEDGGMFGEKIKGREVKVLKPPNVPK